MKTIHIEKPILFFNTGREDKEAYLLIKSSGLSCEFRAPSLDDYTPMLLVGYQRFVGIDAIKSFIIGSQRKQHRTKKV